MGRRKFSEEPPPLPLLSRMPGKEEKAEESLSGETGTSGEGENLGAYLCRALEKEKLSTWKEGYSRYHD